MALVLIVAALGLTIALISFGDRIKEMDKEIAEQSEKFLKKLNTDWPKLGKLLKKNASSDEKLTALGVALASGKPPDYKTIEKFESVFNLREKLMSRYDGNYNSLIFLIVSLIIGIFIDYLIPQNKKVEVWFLTLSDEKIVIIAISLIVIYVIFRLFFTRKKEREFRILMTDIEDSIRFAKDN